VQPDVIQFLIERVGQSQEKIAQRLRCKRSAVSQTIRRVSRSQKIEAEVARTLGMPIGTVFPDRYDNDNRLIRSRRRPTTGIQQSLRSLQSAIETMQLAVQS
jgi:transcriptional regulator with XRE-family HTH domain